jgi:hypothetical protein
MAAWRKFEPSTFNIFAVAKTTERRKRQWQVFKTVWMNSKGRSNPELLHTMRPARRFVEVRAYLDSALAARLFDENPI